MIEPLGMPRPLAIGLRITLAVMAAGVVFMAVGTYGSRTITPVLIGLGMMGVGAVASGIAILLAWRRVDWLMRLGCVGFIASGTLLLDFGLGLLARHA